MDKTIRRRVVYIRSSAPRPLFFRSAQDERIIGKGYQLVRRILYPDMTENMSLEIAAGDKVEITVLGIEGRKIVKILEIPLNPDFTDEPGLVGGADRKKA